MSSFEHRLQYALNAPLHDSPIEPWSEWACRDRRPIEYTNFDFGCAECRCAAAGFLDVGIDPDFAGPSGSLRLSVIYRMAMSAFEAKNVDG